MTPLALDPRELRVLVLTPTGADARVACALLQKAGLAAEWCRDLPDLLGRLSQGAGCLFVAQEALDPPSVVHLTAVLQAQEAWSDLPVILLSTERLAVRVETGSLRTLSEVGNVLLVERPCRAGTLVSVARTALRARRRQYATRKLLHDRAKVRDLAEEANRAKDRFLATLSHELRTPLTPVLATAGILIQDHRLPGDVREDLDVIHRNVELEARLIDDLLDLTRVSKGKLQLNLETVDAHQLIHRVHDICCGEIRMKNLRVDFHLDAPRPFVVADVARLHQMIWNLLKNAAKFTPDHGQITVSTRNSGPPPVGGAEHPSLIIEIRDTGVGIDPQQIPKLFMAFEQGGGNVTRQYGGLGLGLAITKALADAHGGSVSARSNGPGTGATFTLALQTAKAPPPDTAVPLPESLTPHRSLSILLLEDHPDTARVMARVLVAWGHTVLPAGTVADACDLARRASYDLVISDLGLPDGTGVDFMRALRTFSQVPAIALTGYGMEEDVKRSLDAGFQTHITKPVSFAKLESAIADLAGIAVGNP